MKYDAHGLEHYIKAHKIAIRAIKAEKIAFYLSVGWIIYRSIFINQEYIILVPLVVLVAMFILVQKDTARATGFDNLGHFSRLGQPPRLSLNDKGFHFEQGPTYKATLLQEVPNAKGYSEYIYIIKKEETNSYYVARSPVKLPFQAFTFEYSNHTYTFTDHSTPIG